MVQTCNEWPENGPTANSTPILKRKSGFKQAGDAQRCEASISFFEYAMAAASISHCPLQGTITSNICVPVRLAPLVLVVVVVLVIDPTDDRESLGFVVSESEMLPAVRVVANG
jgi:hypothetical protein